MNRELKQCSPGIRSLLAIPPQLYVRKPLILRLFYLNFWLVIFDQLHTTCLFQIPLLHTANGYHCRLMPQLFFYQLLTLLLSANCPFLEGAKEPYRSLLLGMSQAFKLHSENFVVTVYSCLTGRCGTV